MVQNVNNLEAYSVKSLKSQLNDDNKKSQVSIGKMKKNFEQLQKQIEAVNVKFGDCRVMVDNFEEDFENDDLERLNRVQEINEMLTEEEANIYGKVQLEGEENDGQQDIDASHAEEESL